VTRRIDLMGLDEVPDGTMKMAWVDGTEQVLVINMAGEIRAVQGICSHSPISQYLPIRFQTSAAGRFTIISMGIEM